MRFDRLALLQELRAVSGLPWLEDSDVTLTGTLTVRVRDDRNERVTTLPKARVQVRHAIEKQLQLPTL